MKIQRVLKHIVFWIGVFFFYLITYTHDDNFAEYLPYNYINVPLYMLAYYSLQYVLIPYLFQKKKYISFSVSFVIISYAIGSICNVATYHWCNDPDCLSSAAFLTLPMYLSKVIRFYTPAAAIIAYKLQRNQQAEIERLQNLQKEKVETELKYLKSQLNPHFLFNTLNNLYSLIISKSPNAADMVLRLSEILDYTLYKSQAKYVRLAEEIKLIDNYLEMEKIKYGERLKISFTKVNPNYQSQIAPLLLLSIVENAFKHGANGNGNQAEIKISIQENDTQIEFNVWNTKSTIAVVQLNDNHKEGIGLKNIKRQLNLLYPDQYELRVQNKEQYFELNLTINTQNT